MADARRDDTTRQVPTKLGRLHVSDHAGGEPPLVGVLDRYLSPDLAARLASLFPRAGTNLVDGAPARGNGTGPRPSRS